MGVLPFRQLLVVFFVHKNASVAGELTLWKMLRCLKYFLQGRVSNHLWELEAVKDR